MKRDEWLLARRMGIGGSDVAPILGMSPYRSAMDVWLEKKGFRIDYARDPGREFLMSLGLMLEPTIAKLYELQTRRILVPGGETPWRHTTYGCLIGTPDRMVEGLARGVELKTESQFSHQFGDPGTAEVPIHYALQCIHYMAVCDVDIWDIAVLHSGSRFEIYTLERDRELEQLLCEKLVSWWEAHIIGNRPPEIDSSAGWQVYLRRKFPTDTLPMLKAEATDETDLAWLASLRFIAEVIEQRKTEVETRIKLAIGEHAGIESEHYRVTWKRTKDVARVDWKGIVDHLGRLVPRETLVQVLKEHTVYDEGTRRFLFKETGESNDGNRGVKAAIGKIARELTEGANHSDRRSAGESADRGALCNGRAASEGS